MAHVQRLPHSGVDPPSTALADGKYPINEALFRLKRKQEVETKRLVDLQNSQRLQLRHEMFPANSSSSPPQENSSEPLQPSVRRHPPPPTSSDDEGSTQDNQAPTRWVPQRQSLSDPAHAPAQTRFKGTYPASISSTNQQNISKSNDEKPLTPAILTDHASVSPQAFESFVERRLAESTKQSGQNPTPISNNSKHTKQPFLKKGQGLARYTSSKSRGSTKSTKAKTSSTTEESASTRSFGRDDVAFNQQNQLHHEQQQQQQQQHRHEQQQHRHEQQQHQHQQQHQQQHHRNEHQHPNQPQQQRHGQFDRSFDEVSEASCQSSRITPAQWDIKQQTERRELEEFRLLELDAAAQHSTRSSPQRSSSITSPMSDTEDYEHTPHTPHRANATANSLDNAPTPRSQLQSQPESHAHALHAVPHRNGVYTHPKHSSSPSPSPSQSPSLSSRFDSFAANDSHATIVETTQVTHDLSHFDDMDSWEDTAHDGDWTANKHFTIDEESEHGNGVVLEDEDPLSSDLSFESIHQTSSPTTNAASYKSINNTANENNKNINNNNNNHSPPPQSQLVARFFGNRGGDGGGGGGGRRNTPGPTPNIPLVNVGGDNELPRSQYSLVQKHQQEPHLRQQPHQQQQQQPHAHQSQHQHQHQHQQQQQQQQHQQRQLDSSATSTTLHPHKVDMETLKGLSVDERVHALEDELLRFKEETRQAKMLRSQQEIEIKRLHEEELAFRQSMQKERQQFEQHQKEEKRKLMREKKNLGETPRGRARYSFESRTTRD